MHELAVTESILNIALEYGNKNGAAQVTAVNLVIGRLASIVDDSVQFYWDIISQGTICAGARLNFERTPAKLTCLNCGNQYTLDDDLTSCPICQSERVKVIAGDDFHLDSIEITCE
jgi:hydrogenase nickel incorporation protein HypA/HybF